MSVCQTAEKPTAIHRQNSVRKPTAPIIWDYVKLLPTVGHSPLCAYSFPTPYPWIWHRQPTPLIFPFYVFYLQTKRVLFVGAGSLRCARSALFLLQKNPCPHQKNVWLRSVFPSVTSLNVLMKKKKKNILALFPKLCIESAPNTPFFYDTASLNKKTYCGIEKFF